MKRLNRLKAASAAALFGSALALTGPASAGVLYSFTTGVNGNANQSGTADFDVTATTLTLTLTNTDIETSIASILDGFVFAMSGAPTGATLMSIIPAGGFEDCITSGGSTTCTNTATDPSTPSTPTNSTWLASLSAGTVSMGAGSVSSLHPYGIGNSTFAVNASLDGLANAQHNPELIGPVEFHFTLAGLTVAPTITSASFKFGTTPDVIVGIPRVPPPPLLTPEPASIALLGIGLLAFGASRRKSKAQSEAH
jgi:hypothetical protein